MKLFPAIPCLLFVLAMSAFSGDDGPYNGLFIRDGNGLKKPMSTAASNAWTISTWIDWSGPQPGTVIVGGFGAPDSAHRYLVLVNGKLGFAIDKVDVLVSDAQLPAHQLHQAGASFDGTTLTLYLDQQVVIQKQVPLQLLKADLYLAPYTTTSTHFAGKLANFQFSTSAKAPSGIAPRLDLINFEAGSETWPFQTRAQAGYRAPQPPSTLPTSTVAFSQPVAKPAYVGPSMNGDAIVGGWKLAAAPTVTADVARLSAPGFDTTAWYAATIPGTVLTTLIDRGVYPDPDYGLNNMAIPESLNKQDYWYRTEFTLPTHVGDDRLTLTFKGINYLAKVWLNGKPLGKIKGAFIRGIFDVTDTLQSAKPNVLLVRISPPPHPGIPQEQSVKAGPGENGGSMCLDGPTFVATEGWDWIPAVRDRNIGIWQDVTLTATKAVSIGDAQVIATLPLPDTSRASVTIRVPLRNTSDAPITGTLRAAFEGVSINKQVTLKSGDTSFELTPSEFPQLNVSAPRLWWPNGYGKQELYTLQLSFENSDKKQVRFGIRDISYELSLMDHTGKLRRLEIAPAHATNSDAIIQVSHESIIHSNQGWVYSLNPETENSPAVHELTDTRLTPFLVIKVNGVRIAAKGGAWGMDDLRKRVSRERLEPFFKLHHDANLNIIRNWVGQSTEETFFDLADEYGLLVFNDFWQSTQNYNVEPTDTALFLANARDTIQRFRNHPSIVLWCGRNEGVPAPALNVTLDELIRQTDGTRFYAPSSNTINLQDSGPYKYYPPVDYFTRFDRGFSVEVGIPSFPTLDSFKSFVPESQQWPINDTWAYHDWHQSGNGVMQPFMTALTAHYGLPTSLEDFEHKAQLMNYVGHQAIFEGMNAGLWTANSGRMLWMTQPAWPSTVWQILSSDYDTQASYYGVKKASEQIHIQMNLPDLKVAVINNTTQHLQNLTARAKVFSFDGKLLATEEKKLDAAPIAVSDALELGKSISAGLVFVSLDLTDSAGNELSRNFYWYSREASDYLVLNQLPAPVLKMNAFASAGKIEITLENPSSNVSVMNKVTLQHSADGSRILPAYYSDNYVSLLPGERRQITIESPLLAGHDSVQVGISGWNQQPSVVKVK